MTEQEIQAMAEAAEIKIFAWELMLLRLSNRRTAGAVWVYISLCLRFGWHKNSTAWGSELYIFIGVICLRLWIEKGSSVYKQVDL